MSLNLSPHRQPWWRVRNAGAQTLVWSCLVVVNCPFSGQHAREGYPSRRRKCNNFNAYGVFGRGKEARYFRKLRQLLAKMDADDRKLLLHMVQKMAHGRG